MSVWKGEGFVKLSYSVGQDPCRRGLVSRGGGMKKKTRRHERENGGTTSAACGCNQPTFQLIEEKSLET